MSRPTSGAILLDALAPRASTAQNLLLVASGSLLMALCAQISLPLPFSPVPVTGQTFGVLLLAAMLGARRSAMALLLYLGEGAAGLPVFAPGAAPGLARLLGPAGGYLLAFPLAALTMGWVLEHFGRRFWPLGVLVAEILILGVGASWLKIVTGLELGGAVSIGVLPFVPGEVLKIGVFAFCWPTSWWVLKRHRRGSGL